MKNILDIIEDQSYQGEIELFILNEVPKISDSFPNFRIKVNNTTLVTHLLTKITKLLVSFPVKLKFTIAPEFDPAYLLNFDIDKI